MKGSIFFHPFWKSTERKCFFSPVHYSASRNGLHSLAARVLEPLTQRRSTAGFSHLSKRPSRFAFATHPAAFETRNAFPFCPLSRPAPRRALLSRREIAPQSGRQPVPRAAPLSNCELSIFVKRGLPS